MSQIKFKEFRESYLLEKFHVRPPASEMAVLSADTKQTFPFAVFISKAFTLRTPSVARRCLGHALGFVSLCWICCFGAGQLLMPFGFFYIYFLL